MDQDKYDLQDVAEFVVTSRQTLAEWNKQVIMTCLFLREGGAGEPSEIHDEKLVLNEDELFVVARFVFPDGARITIEMHVPKGHWAWSSPVGLKN